jgi:Tol biopolymer transport system component
LAAAAFAALYFMKSAEQILRSWRVSPLTSYQGQELHPALSQNGEQVAFVGQRGPRETGDFYVRLVEGGTPLQLTDSPENEVWPTWSPDGSRVAFARGDSIFEVSSLGGSERRFTTLESPVAEGLDWSPDGRWIAASTRNGLRLVEIGPGHVVQVSESSSTEAHPKFFPDSSSLAFAHGSSQFLRALYILPLDANGEPAGEASASTETVWGMRGGLDWFPDGERLVFSTALGSRTVLWEIPADSSDVLRLLPIDTDRAFGITVSGDSLRLVYARTSLVSDILRVPLDEGATVVGPTDGIIASTRSDTSVLYSPDGSRLIYRSAQTGYSEIWRSDADETNEIQLTNMKTSLLGSPAWSPDGEQIAYDAYFDGHSDIYVIRSEGGDPVQVTTDTSNEDRPFSFALRRVLHRTRAPLLRNQRHILRPSQDSRPRSD